MYPKQLNVKETRLYKYCIRSFFINDIIGTTPNPSILHIKSFRLLNKNVTATSSNTKFKMLLRKSNKNESNFGLLLQTVHYTPG